MNWKELGKKSILILRFYPSIRLEGLKKHENV
jgi:hypothetical protein